MQKFSQFDENNLLKDLKDAIDKISVEENRLKELQIKKDNNLNEIGNMLNAIQQGIITPSTKQRMDELESRRNELILQIGKEKMTKPSFTKEQIVFWFQRFRKLDTNKLEHRRRLIDSFINVIFLYDDKMVITFNYKDGAKTITFADLEKSEIRSDMNCSGEP